MYIRQTALCRARHVLWIALLCLVFYIDVGWAAKRSVLIDHLDWTDSDDCATDGRENCVDPHHVTIRLSERDDELAKRIAAEHGFKVVGKPFLDSVYFLEHLNNGHERRVKRDLFDSISQHPLVLEATEQVPKRRTKRDNRQDEPPKTPVRLPWPDPLYKDQWYLVSGTVAKPSLSTPLVFYFA